MADHDSAPRLPLASRIWSSSVARFLVIGGLCFAVDLGLLWIGHEVLGIPVAVATPVAFLVSFFLTYTLQRIVSFASDARVPRSLLRYTTLVALNTVATTAIVWLSTLTPAGWLGGKVVAVIATTTWNYFAYRYWVFPAPGNRSALAASGPEQRNRHAVAEDSSGDAAR